jgi:hypothetical protein
VGFEGAGDARYALGESWLLRWVLEGFIDMEGNGTNCIELRSFVELEEEEMLRDIVVKSCTCGV